MSSLRPYGCCASSTTRIRRTRPAALSRCRRRDVLREFLATGAAAPGVTPRIETNRRGRDARGARRRRRGVADQRARRRRAVPAGGHARCHAGGVFTSIPTRSTASKTPIFRDLAPDVFWATEALIRLVQREAAALARGGAAAGASHLDDGGPVVIPEGGTF